MARLFDTHCHVNFKAFEKDWKEVVEKTLREGVDMVVVGTDLETSKKAVAIAKEYSGVYAAVGFHPTHVFNRDWRSEIIKIADLIANPNVVAIGEVGFDLYRINESEQEETLKTQDVVFSFFIEEAKKHKKPLIIHNRDAMDQLLKKIPDLKRARIMGVQHCYPGTLDEAKELFAAGFKIGFTGMITYNNSWDELIPQIPLENILIETDSPYLTPIPYRGTRNEPKHVALVAKKIAELCGIDQKSVIEQTAANAKYLFGIRD